MKGQVSIEMLIVFGLGIALVGVYTIYGYSTLDSYKKSNDLFLMEDSLDKISETSRFVSLQGEPATQQINICFPVSFSNCSISTGTITCFLKSGQKIERDVGTPVNGSLPSVSGCWDLSVKAHPGFVNISVS